MAEENENDLPEESGEGQEGKKKSSKKLLIILIPLILGGVVAGLFFSGVIKPGGSDENAGAEDNKIVYYDMKEFLINLNNPGNQVSFLKTTITLEVEGQRTLKEIKTKMPRIRDTFQVYLRELRSSDLQGSAGLQRLRKELLLRINSNLEDGVVKNILFKEIIVQ